MRAAITKPVGREEGTFDGEAFLLQRSGIRKGVRVLEYRREKWSQKNKEGLCQKENHGEGPLKMDKNAKAQGT